MSPAHLAKLQTCDQRLIDLFTKVDNYWPCGIATGYRDEQAQDEAVATGESQDPWPTSKHNGIGGEPPSLAVDAFPTPLDWNDIQRFIYFAGFVKGIAALSGVVIRWGGDFKQTLDPAMKGFKDWDHFEIVGNAQSSA